MDPIITAENLTKIYRMKNVKMTALDQASIAVYPGEVCAIVGTSGSGKSTLLSLLAGLERPTSGKVFIKGKPIHRMNENQLVAFRLHHIGFVFQAFNLFPVLTAWENAAFGLACRGEPRPLQYRKAKKLLSRMGLQDHLNHKPIELSGGQQQRVSIARAVLPKPDIIFADEPTGNLDSHTSQQIMDMLLELVRDNGATLVFVTHDLEKARQADRIIHITDGKTELQGR